MLTSVLSLKNDEMYRVRKNKLVEKFSNLISFQTQNPLKSNGALWIEITSFSSTHILALCSHGLIANPFKSWR